MSNKIEQQDIDIAIANLVLPNFVLEEARNQKKQFDEIIKTYKQKRLFNHYLGENDNSKRNRIDKLQNSLNDLKLPEFFADAKKLGEINSDWSQKIEGTAKKLLNELQKKTAKDIERVAKQPNKTTTQTSTSDNKINWSPWNTPTEPSNLNYKTTQNRLNKTLNNLQKIIKTYSSPRIFNVRLKKGSEFKQMPEAKEIYQLIHELQYYYNAITNCNVLDQMNINMYETLCSIDKEFNSTLTINKSQNLEYGKNDKFKKLFVLYNDKTNLKYKDRCADYLRNALNEYNTRHKSIKDLKNLIKQQTFGEDIAYEPLQSMMKTSHSYLKNFNAMKTTIENFVKNHPKYAKFLKKPIDLIKNQNLDSTLKLYEHEMKEQIYLIKYGQLKEPNIENDTPTYQRILEADMLLDHYVSAINEFINALNNSKSKESEILDKYTALTKVQSNLKKTEEISHNLDGKKFTTESKKSQEDSYGKLLNYNKEITEKMASWETHYTKLQQALAAYEQATSNITKAKKIANIVGILVGLATGSCKINASLGKDGFQIGVR